MIDAGRWNVRRDPSLLLRMTQKKDTAEFGIWTLTRRIEDDAPASPCQGEARRWTPGSLDSADFARDDTKKGPAECDA